MKPNVSNSMSSLSPPPLYSMIDRRQFDDALQRLRTHPQEARCHCLPNVHSNGYGGSVALGATSNVTPSQSRGTRVDPPPQRTGGSRRSNRQRNTSTHRSPPSTAATSAARSSQTRSPPIESSRPWPPLHLACSKRDVPPQLIKALLKSYQPAANIKVGKHNETALHLAALKIIDSNFTSGVPNDRRKSEREEDINDGSIQILRSLLEQDFNLIGERNSRGYTVVESLWRKLLNTGHDQYLDHVRKMRRKTSTRHANVLRTNDTQQLNEENIISQTNDSFPTLESFLPQLRRQLLLQDRQHPLFNQQIKNWWCHLSYLLKVQCYRTTEDPFDDNFETFDDNDSFTFGDNADDGPSTLTQRRGRQWSTLYAALQQADCLYSDLVQFVMMMYMDGDSMGPCELLGRAEDDEDDNILHVLLNNCPSSKELNSVGDPTECENANLNVLLSLLQRQNNLHFDMARQRSNRNGLLPLHIAIQKGIEWDRGVQALIQAFPESLLSSTIVPRGESGDANQERASSETDGKSFDILPLMLAANVRATTLDTLFELILACPSALESQRLLLER